jgi:hypothetical protein
MLSYPRLSKNPSLFRSFAGLDVSKFDSLFGNVESKYEEYEKERLSRRDRKNEVGAGHPFKLLFRDRLLMLLAYYRLYATSTLLGFLFDLGQILERGNLGWKLGGTLEKPVENIGEPRRRPKGQIGDAAFDILDAGGFSNGQLSRILAADASTISRSIKTLE